MGKTTVMLALMGVLPARGRRMQSFKAGPDFINPGHHSVVIGHPSRNLDGWMLDAARNHETFAYAEADVELSIHGARGVMTGADGLLAHNTQALYTHLHFASQRQMTRVLVAAAIGSRTPSGVQR